MRLLWWWWFRGTKGRIRNTDSLFLLCQFIRTDWPRDWTKASYLSPWTTRKLSSWRWATPCIKLIAAEAWLSEGVHWTHSLGSRCKCSANLLGWSPWIKYCTSLLSTVVHFFLLIFAIRWPPFLRRRWPKDPPLLLIGRPESAVSYFTFSADQEWHFTCSIVTCFPLIIYIYLYIVARNWITIALPEISVHTQPLLGAQSRWAALATDKSMPCQW